MIRHWINNGYKHPTVQGQMCPYLYYWFCVQKENHRPLCPVCWRCFQECREKCDKEVFDTCVDNKNKIKMVRTRLQPSKAPGIWVFRWLNAHWETTSPTSPQYLVFNQHQPHVCWTEIKSNFPMTLRKIVSTLASTTTVLYVEICTEHEAVFDLKYQTYHTFYKIWDERL